MTIADFITDWETFTNETVSDADALFFFNEIDQDLYYKLIKVYPEKFVTSCDIIHYDTGTAEFVAGETLTGGTSTYTATINTVINKSGTWAGGDAEGVLLVTSLTGRLTSDETITSLSGSATYNSNSFVSGYKIYTLPSDFYNMNYPTVTGIYEYDTNDEVLRSLPETEQGSNKYGFYLDGTNFILTPEEDTGYWKIRYIPTKDLYTATSDTLLLDDRYEKLYRDLFSYLYYTKNENYQLASVYQQFAAQGENRMLREFNATQKPVIIRSSYK